LGSAINWGVGELLPEQFLELHHLEWPQLVLIFCGAGFFLTTLLTLHLRYSGRDPAVINNEAQKFGWIALLLSSITIIVEYFLIRRGWSPKGASLI
jgi:hypothetical protein